MSRYRYPETPSGVGVTTTLRGPERVFRFRIAKRVVNAGVVITQRGAGARVEPRIVAGARREPAHGIRRAAGQPESVHGRVPRVRARGRRALAAPGEYAAVFDSATRAGAGAFTFRYWVNDVTPPVLRLRTPSVSRGKPALVSATDAGAGVYPRVDPRSPSTARPRRGTLRGGLLSIPTGGLSPGTHRLRVRVSDYQESKNTENVARILPNTRTATFTFRVR